MCPVCAVCTHKNIKKINEQLTAGESCRRIASQYGLHYQAVTRHKKNHLPDTLVKSKDAEIICHADDLLTQQNRLLKLSWDIANRFISQGDDQGALKAISQIRENLKVLLEVEGKINQRNQFNVILSPQFLQIQTILMDELKKYPHIRTRISERLGEIKTI